MTNVSVHDTDNVKKKKLHLKKQKWKHLRALSRLERWDIFLDPTVWHTSALTEEEELEVEFWGLAGQRSDCFSSQPTGRSMDLLDNLNINLLLQVVLQQTHVICANVIF